MVNHTCVWMRDQPCQLMAWGIRVIRTLLSIGIEVWPCSKQFPSVYWSTLGVRIVAGPDAAKGRVEVVGDDPCTTTAVVCCIILGTVRVDARMVTGVERCPQEGPYHTGRW